jgi:hypothetical protein
MTEPGEPREPDLPRDASSASVVLPGGRRVVFAVTSCRLLPGPQLPGGRSGGERAEAVVIKDAGDAAYPGRAG